MDSAKVVCMILEERYNDLPFDNPQFIDGVFKYCNDQKIDEFAGDKEVISFFINPLMDMSREMIIKYFKHFGIVKRLQDISNIIYDMAYQKRMYGEESMDNIDALENEFNNILLLLVGCVDLKTEIDMIVSETVMDIDFIKGKNNNMSMRLGMAVSK